MNRTRKLLALLLAAVLLLSLAGCTSKDENLREKLTGSWQCEVDISKTLLNGMASGIGDDDALAWAVNNMTLDTLMLRFDLEIEADSSYTMCVSSQSVQEMIDSAAPAITKMMRDYLEAILTEACAQANITLDTLFQYSEVTSLDEYVEKEMGISIDAFVLELLQLSFDDSGLEDLREDGTVSVKDGKITLHSSEYTYPADYDEKTDTLTLEEYVEELDISNFLFSRKK